MRIKKMTVILVVILALTVLVSTIMAQKGRGMGERPKPPVLSALDADGDGIISADELRNVVAALKTLDKNSDGEISREELRPDRGVHGGSEVQGEGEDRQRDHRMKPPLLTALDSDGDHKISAGEITNAENALRELDTNGDGKLTDKEIHPKRRNQ